MMIKNWYKSARTWLCSHGWHWKKNIAFGYPANFTLWVDVDFCHHCKTLFTSYDSGMERRPVRRMPLDQNCFSTVDGYEVTMEVTKVPIATRQHEGTYVDKLYDNISVKLWKWPK